MATRMDAERERKALDLYRSGLATRAVAAQVGCSKATVRNILCRHNVRVRGFSEARRRLKLNEAAFDQAEDNSAARYWLGMLLTDGYVGVGRRFDASHRPAGGRWTLGLALAEEDRAHVEAFRSFLGSEAPIRRRERKNWKIMGRPSCAQPLLTFAADSRRLVEAVARYGIVPRKSWTASVFAPLAFCPHFWRGCVDGDGGLGWHRTGRWLYPKVRLIGTFAVCDAFAGFCRSVAPATAARVGRATGETRTFDVQGGSGLAVIRAIYGPDGPVLARKGALAKEMLGTPDGKRLYINAAGGVVPLHPPAKAIFSPEQDRKIRTEYEAGASLVDLGDKWGCPYMSISRAIKRAGGKNRPQAGRAGTEVRYL